MSTGRVVSLAVLCGGGDWSVMWCSNNVLLNTSVLRECLLFL